MRFRTIALYGVLIAIIAFFAIRNGIPFFKTLKTSTFKNDELGITFDYPASWGDAMLTTVSCSPIDGGSLAKAYRGWFSNNPQCIFGGASRHRYGCHVADWPGGSRSDNRYSYGDPDFTGWSDPSPHIPLYSDAKKETSGSNVEMLIDYKEPSWSISFLGGTSPGFLTAEIPLPGSTFYGMEVQCYGRFRSAVDVSIADRMGFSKITESFAYLRSPVPIAEPPFVFANNTQQKSYETVLQWAKDMKLNESEGWTLKNFNFHEDGTVTIPDDIWLPQWRSIPPFPSEITRAEKGIYMTNSNPNSLRLPPYVGGSVSLDGAKLPSNLKGLPSFIGGSLSLIDLPSSTSVPEGLNIGIGVVVSKSQTGLIMDLNRKGYKIIHR